MAAPVSFNLPIFGTAPNQYTTEQHFEMAVQQFGDKVFDEAIKNGGKLFSSRESAVAAGQDALPASVGLIITREGDQLVLRSGGLTTDDPLFASAPRWGVLTRVPAQAAIDLLLAGKADITNSGKSFISRAAAVAMGQAALPASLGQIETREGDYLVQRTPTAGANDPLFETSPRWGVVARYPVQQRVEALVGAAAAIPLSIAAGTTANEIFADAPADLAPVSVKVGSFVRVTPTQDNTGPVVLRTGGLTLNLRDEVGAALAARVVRAGVPITAVVTASNEARIIGLNQDRAAFAGGALADGTDINTVITPGVYYGNPAHTYVNTPDGMAGLQWMLEVRAPKAGSDNLRRWVIQTAWAFTSMAGPRTRRIDGLAPAGSYAWNLVGGGYVGSVTGVDLSTMTTPGLYLIGMAGVPDKPEGFAGTTGLLEVRAYGTYVVQTMRYPLEPVVGWMRTVRPGSPPTVYAWQRSKAGGAGGASYVDARAVFFGDSVVANSDYPARVGDRLGLAQAINAGFGGARMGPGGSIEPFSMVSLANAIATGNWSAITAFAETYYSDTSVDVRPRVATLAALDWTTVDYITIAYGSNDWANGVPVGAASDTDTGTICGAANTAIQTILTAYPHLQLMIISPHWRARQVPGDAKDSDAYPNAASGQYLIEVVDGLRAVAERWHVPFCDLYRTMGLNLLTYRPYLRDQTVDGLHPYGAVGAQLFADKVASQFAARF